MVQNAKGITKKLLCVLQFFESREIWWLSLQYLKIKILKKTESK